MYRMLIVDDEEIITDGLAVIFGKMNLDLDLYKAYSGQEALSLLGSTRVDIVLSDICMPGMDGLELMGKIHRNWPQCKIVFLTGHSDFNYVYQAIQAPSVQYVLKNEGYPKLIEAVKRALKELDDAMRVNNLIRQSKEQLDTLETLAQGDYFRHLVHSINLEQDVQEDFNQLRIPLDASMPVLIALGSLSYPHSSQSYADRQELALAVKFLSEKLLKERTVSLGIIDRHSDLIWLIQPDSQQYADQLDTFEQMVIFLEGTFELIQQACLESLGIMIAVTLGVEESVWASLPFSYEKIRQFQHYRVGDGNRMVQKVVPMEAVLPDSVRDRSLRDKSETLTAHLEAGRKNEFFTLFEEMVEPASHESERGSPYLTELYYTVALMLMSYINRWETDEQIGGHGLAQLEKHRSWEEAFGFLKDNANFLFSIRKNGEQKRAASAIDKVCSYIEDNITQDLSLIRLADVIHFNPSYLSRLFKQERGINLSEYIEEIRIRQAKELLKREELKVAEVGSLIGYVTPQSFTRFFKKWTGTTPQEYRVDMQSNNN